jgi:hypothetical protein
LEIRLAEVVPIYFGFQDFSSSLDRETRDRQLIVKFTYLYQG